MISGFYTPFIFPSFYDEDVLFTSLSTPPPSAPTLNAIKLLASLTHFPKGNAAVSSKLATAGLCMIMPIYSVWWFIPVLRCVVQSWVDIHSFQSVFPSLLSKCHFPFVQHSFPASSMIPGGIQKKITVPRIYPKVLTVTLPAIPISVACHLPDGHGLSLVLFSA